ncbi:hypothetical protein T459_24239 [Capsicum annuum]|uniref:Uncharacterized protein n=1 Tax=Capsicum annuum TaxID=4072 RepID=A0A2G2YUS9_CAPAN|nr:hypothetical protein T459_24239 [Capsicum annuum]
MAYRAITCLMRTIHQSMELTGCDLQPFYEKLECLRAILEKPWKATDDVEALTSLEAEITELAYSAEDMIDLESMDGNIVQHERSKSTNVPLASLPEHAVEWTQNMMVGYETEFEMMLDQLARGERELEVVSVVGMGGIGKTTFATNLYSDPRIMSHFDILAKATVSQEHCVRNILLALLSTKSAEPDDELTDRLQKLLKRKRYLVVIDDIWTTEAWDDIKLCFPDSNNGSRILLRNVEVAEYTSSGKSLGDWQSVASNVSSVSTDVDVQCMKVLALSYHYLPSHLKPCFLYFAILAEDQLIFVDKVVQLWVAEGFLKVEEMKSIGEVAETCLNQLIDRSLISICEHPRFGKIESCGMHDVTREFCLREAQNMNFLNDLRGKSDQNSCTQSMQCSCQTQARISIHNEEEYDRCHNSEAYSFICFGRFRCCVTEFPFKLVRVLHLALRNCINFPSEMLHRIHLRYLSLSLCSSSEEHQDIPPIIMDIPPSISCLFYLQTFILNLSGVGLQYPIMLLFEILTMPQLRHLRLDWIYLRSHEPTEKSLVLKNLQCFSGLNPRYCTGSFFRLFPNLKKLGSTTPSGSTPQYRLRFQKEKWSYPADDVPLLLIPPSDAFTQNLKSLALRGQFFLPWKDLSIVGKLPKLESLKLSYNACEGIEWEVADEGFPRLKFFQLNYLGIQIQQDIQDSYGCSVEVHTRPVPPVDCLLSPIGLPLRPMKAYLKALSLWEAVESENDPPPLGPNPTVAQMKNYEDAKSKKPKALTCLHSALLDVIFTKIMACETPKEVWEKLNEELMEVKE